jgi:hypothetical protein
MRYVALLFIVVAGCEDTTASPRPLPSDVPPTPSAITDLQRPTRVYYVSNRNATCHLHWRDGDERSVEVTVRCPRDLEDGEHIRLAGHTCLRESDQQGRALPVRCPKELFKAREHDAADAGEWLLRRQH